MPDRCFVSMITRRQDAFWARVACAGQLGFRNILLRTCNLTSKRFQCAIIARFSIPAALWQMEVKQGNAVKWNSVIGVLPSTVSFNMQTEFFENLWLRHFNVMIKTLNVWINFFADVSRDDYIQVAFRPCNIVQVLIGAWSPDSVIFFTSVHAIIIARDRVLIKAISFSYLSCTNENDSSVQIKQRRVLS